MYVYTHIYVYVYDNNHSTKHFRHSAHSTTLRTDETNVFQIPPPNRIIYYVVANINESHRINPKQNTAFFDGICQNTHWIRMEERERKRERGRSAYCVLRKTKQFNREVNEYRENLLGKNLSLYG